MLLITINVLRLPDPQDWIRHCAGLTGVDVATATQGFGQELATCLDADQMAALMACLHQELTLIQGPPGTGDLLWSSQGRTYSPLVCNLPVHLTFNLMHDILVSSAKLWYSWYQPATKWLIWITSRSCITSASSLATCCAQEAR